MKVRDISGAKQNFVGKFVDNVGAVRKRTQLERLEPYADIINEVLEKYNTDDDKRTMMFKLLRNPKEGTTNRRKHTENCAEIAGEIADSFKWLNSDITRVMARHHDIGHTFLGHSGEWWLSSIKDTYGMPNFVHNAIGARNLSIRYRVQDEIAQRIKQENPNILPFKLNAIKNDLWLIFDAINDHNGEKSEYSYAPDFTKTKSRFYDELMGCYTKKGFDRTLIPATAEGSLMRLTDKISYIPFDLVDIFRNNCNVEKRKIGDEEYNFYDEYKRAFLELGMPEDSLERLLACKTEEEYDNFAKEIQKIFIEDVKKNTKRNNIRMSPEMSSIMHRIRDINNKLMVNYTVMKEDHEQYVPVLEGIMQASKRFLVRSGLINEENPYESDVAQFYKNDASTKLLMDSVEYDELTRMFADYIITISPEDLAFTVDSCKKSFEETIKGEIDVARAVTTGTVDAVEIQAEGLKKKRVESYIREFDNIVNATYEDKSMQKMMNPLSTSFVDQFKRQVWLDKISEKIKAGSIEKLRYGDKEYGITPLHEMVAMEIGAQFLASLNDYDWRRVFELYSSPSKEVMASLARPYDTFDHIGESQTHKTWNNIAKLQAKEAELGSSGADTTVFAKIKRNLKIDKEEKELEK